MKEKRKAAVWGAFVADALALGVHWVYNVNVIDKKFGRIQGYVDPITSFHEGKKAGDFTHYGDQMLLLLESMDENGVYDESRFALAWREFFSTYKGYFDKATKGTLENMAAGKGETESGSASDDLAGASRIAALISTDDDDPEHLVHASRSQTAITHRDERVIQSADFFSRVAMAVLGGESPVVALETIAGSHFSDSDISDLIHSGLESRERNTRQAISDFGQMCSIGAGLPGTIHLICRYADDFATAMVENVMAGGDSSARESWPAWCLARPTAWRLYRRDGYRK